MTKKEIGEESGLLHGGEMEKGARFRRQPLHRKAELREKVLCRKKFVNVLGMGPRRVAFDVRDGFGATFADGGIAGIFADVSGVVAAAIALFTIGALDGDFEAGDELGAEIAAACAEKFDLGNDEESRETRQIVLELGL